MKDIWRVWDEDTHYGEVLYKRATGELPEMESSKAMAKHLSHVVKTDTRILDVGCGAGHYLRSFRSKITASFYYTGLDATKNYVELAQKAFTKDKKADFAQGDIFNIPYTENQYDIVLSSNLLLHLPSIEKPINELIRVSKHWVIIRSLIGVRSFRILVSEIQGDEFLESGEPKNYSYYNIYSKDYLSFLLKRNAKVKNFEFLDDWDYDPKRIDAARGEHDGAMDASCMFGKWQANGYILQPWCFVKIALREG